MSDYQGGWLPRAPVGQLTLLDPRARTTDDQASHDAAKRATRRAGQYDAGIFDLLNTYRELTKNQICGHLGIDGRHWPTVASRLSQLKDAGRLEWAGRIEGDGNLWRIATETVATGEAL